MRRQFLPFIASKIKDLKSDFQSIAEISGPNFMFTLIIGKQKLKYRVICWMLQYLCQYNGHILLYFALKKGNRF